MKAMGVQGCVACFGQFATRMVILKATYENLPPLLRRCSVAHKESPYRRAHLVQDPINNKTVAKPAHSATVAILPLLAIGLPRRVKGTEQEV